MSRKSAPSIANNMISADQAAQIAIQYLGGGSVRKIELENERGVPAYEVKVGDSKVYVDAHTGQVVYSKVKARRWGEWEHEEREWGEGEWGDD